MFSVNTPSSGISANEHNLSSRVLEIHEDDHIVRVIKYEVQNHNLIRYTMSSKYTRVVLNENLKFLKLLS